MHQKLDDEPIPSEITLVRSEFGGEDIVIGYVRDLREWNKTMGNMREADERTKLMQNATPLCCNHWNKGLQKICCNQEEVKRFELSSKQEYRDRFYKLSPDTGPTAFYPRNWQMNIS